MNIFITFEKSKLISWMPAIATKLKRTAPFSRGSRAGNEVKSYKYISKLMAEPKIPQCSLAGEFDH